MYTFLKINKFVEKINKLRNNTKKCSFKRKKKFQRKGSKGQLIFFYVFFFSLQCLNNKPN